MARGTVMIDSRRCKGCGLCIAVCPQHVLSFSLELNAQGYHPVSLIEERLDGVDGVACTGCALCALVCPDVAFTVYREPLQQRTRVTSRAETLRCAEGLPQEVIHERTLEG